MQCTWQPFPSYPFPFPFPLPLSVIPVTRGYTHVDLAKLLEFLECGWSLFDTCSTIPPLIMRWKWRASSCMHTIVIPPRSAWSGVVWAHNIMLCEGRASWGKYMWLWYYYYGTHVVDFCIFRRSQGSVEPSLWQWGFTQSPSVIYIM